MLLGQEKGYQKQDGEHHKNASTGTVHFFPQFAHGRDWYLITRRVLALVLHAAKRARCLPARSSSLSWLTANRCSPTSSSRRCSNTCACSLARSPASAFVSW